MFFILFKRNNNQKALRVIFFYILYCVANEGIGYYLQSIKSENFNLLIYAFTIVEYSFFCYFIYLVLPKNFIRNIVPYIWLGFIIFAFIDIIFINKESGFDSFASSIESIIILLLCIYYLLERIRNSNSLLIYSTFNFWVVIAFFIYFSGTFLLYLLTNKMAKNTSFQKIYLIINISFNILKNVLLCFAMTMKLNDTVNQQKTTIPELDDDIFLHAKNQLPN